MTNIPAVLKREHEGVALPGPAGALPPMMTPEPAVRATRRHK